MPRPGDERRKAHITRRGKGLHLHQLKKKSVDEVTGVSRLKVPSPIVGNKDVDKMQLEAMTEEIPQVTLEEQIQQSMEKVILSEWLEVMQSGVKANAPPLRLSWAEEMAQNKVNPKSPVVSLVLLIMRIFRKRLSISHRRLFAMYWEKNIPLTVIEGFFKRIWGNLGIDKIAMIGKGMLDFHFGCLFESEE